MEISFLFQSLANQHTSSANHKKELEKFQEEHLKRQQENIISHQNKIQELQSQISSQYASAKNVGIPPSPQHLMFLPFLEQLHRMPGSGLPVHLGQNPKGKFDGSMMPPCSLPSWVSATAQLAQISANVGNKSPPASKTPPPEESDAPLNLTKPKIAREKSLPHEQPLASTTPKLLPPNLMMPRAFMPYALPSHLSPLGSQKSHHSSPKDSMPSPDKHSHFQMPMYMGGPPSHHHVSGGKGHHPPRDDPPGGKDEADFMAASKSNIFDTYLTPPKNSN